MQATQPTHPSQPTHNPSSRRSRRQRVIAATAIVLVLLALAIASLGGGAPSSGADGSRAASRSGTDSSDGAKPAVATASQDADSDADDAEQAEDALGAEDDSHLLDDVELSSGSGGGGVGDVDLDPVGDGPASDPCDDLPADGRSLLVVPDPVVLPSGDLDDELYVRNCGAQSVSWTALTKPSVALSAASGTLAPGELTAIGFVIDHTAWEPGAIDFKIKVSEPGFNEYVDVHAFRSAAAMDYVATTDFSAGPHSGGCAQQCITKAQLSSGYATTDVGLDVSTNVATKVRVYLAQHAPVTNSAGNPVFPGKPPRASSPDGVTAWSTTLTNLQAATKYYIIVKATDGYGNTAYQSGSFWTVTPVQNPGGFAGNDPEPGCSYQCITKAVVTPGKALAPSHLSVKSHTPAQFQVWVSTKAPTYQAGVPSLPGAEVWHNSGLAYSEGWELDIHGLQPGTTYYGVVRATDANGRSSHAVGSFTTAGLDVRIDIHKVHVTQDGDSGKHNRGELRFAWGVGDDTAGTLGERKMHAGESVTFGDHSTYTVHDAKGYLPAVYVSAFERDPDGKVEFCSMGNGVAHSPGSNGACDVKWNVASSGHLTTVDGIGSMSRCSTMGLGGSWANKGCMFLFSEDLNDDYPEFWALVSFTIVD